MYLQLTSCIWALYDFGSGEVGTMRSADCLATISLV